MKWLAIASLAMNMGIPMTTTYVTEPVDNYSESTDMVIFRNHLNYRLCHITNTKVNAIEQIIWEELKVRICDREYE